MHERVNLSAISNRQRETAGQRPARR